MGTYQHSCTIMSHFFLGAPSLPWLKPTIGLRPQRVDEGRTAESPLTVNGLLNRIVLNATVSIHQDVAIAGLAVKGGVSQAPVIAMK